jgi:H+/Cl- antiporter ClcA
MTKLGKPGTDTVRYLLFLFISAAIAGFVGTATVYIFIKLYTLIQYGFTFIPELPLLAYPLIGAFATAAIIYRIEPKSMGEGIPSYLEGINEGGGHLPFRETFFKFWAALFTLSTFGNGGFIGPVGRVSAGIMSSLGKLAAPHLKRKNFLSLYTICGLSSAVAALLGSPIGAGIFAVEIIQKEDMKYRDLFPSILSSGFSVYFARVIGLKPVFSINSIHKVFDVQIIPWIFLIALVAGATGFGYIKLYEKISRLFHRDHNHRNSLIILKAVLGSLVAGLIALLINVNIHGASKGLFEAIFAFDAAGLYGNLPDFLPLFLVLLIVLIMKALANCFTVGAGLSAGFTGPAMLIGLLIGGIFVSLAGIEPGTPDFYAFLAAGFAGMLSSTMNTPIATAIITLELFGFAYSLPAGIASIIGFQVNRSNTLYDFATSERKTEFE